MLLHGVVRSHSSDHVEAVPSRTGGEPLPGQGQENTVVHKAPQYLSSFHTIDTLNHLRSQFIGGGALYAVYAEAYTVFLCVC